MEKTTTEATSKTTKAKKSINWGEVGYQLSIVAVNGLVYGLAAGAGGIAATKIASSFNSEDATSPFHSSDNVVSMKKVINS